jgi:hypothetical protein
VSAVARIASTIAPAASAGRSALDGFLRDIDSLFVPPLPLPSPDVRAQRLVDSIDWSSGLVVIWVPGTNDHEVPEEIARRLAEAGVDHPYVVDYASTWQLRSSVPDGEATLRAVLELVAKRKRRGQRVVLLGESQGAWVISSILRDPRLAKVVDRASLMAHPALAPAHVHESTSTSDRLDPRRVQEFNRDGDVVTREVGKSHDRVLDVVDSFAGLRVGHALLGALAIAVTDPGLLGALVASQLFRVQGTENPHGSSDFVGDAISWIVGR